MSSITTTSAPNSSPMMSSKEIAELTGKRHDNVVRDIKDMVSQILGHSSDLRNEQIQGVTVEKDHRGFIKVIHLDHSHTITLITGYDARQRKRVVDRWLELEAKPAIAPETPEMLAFRAITALQGKLEVIEEQAKLQAAMLEAAQPKAAALDAISEAEGDIGVRDAGRELGVGVSKVVAFLLDHKWACREGEKKKKLRPAHYGLSQKYCRLVPKAYPDRHTGETCIGHDFKITTRGLARLAILLCGTNSEPARRLNGMKEKGAPVPFAKTPA
ncbi:phage regulatory protein/antirepressor Ant [Acetobacter cerevisiae]|uniref:phage regulatory protein/antirepressor Ant n=1 Tax=Acetobacter cerevisiae TaxID=178900 RepID=UPI0009EA275E|nr:phage regulatory protein/antirepressor Ant [Acetobacter cerevisiae]GBQ10331.1 putative phage-encoded protein [Acetobacter cerevisiae DSM 14362]